MTKSMFLFYTDNGHKVTLSNVYHFSAKSTPANVNFPISLIVTYAVAIVVTVLIALFFPTNNGLASELKQLNWASFLLAVAIVGIEFGFLLVYRSGWEPQVEFKQLVEMMVDSDLKRLRKK